MRDIRGFEGRIQVADCLYKPEEPFGAVFSVDRQALIDLLDKCTELQKSRGGEIGGFEITMPCGYSKQFTTHSDIPFEDLPCKCGDEGHFLIRHKKDG